MPKQEKGLSPEKLLLLQRRLQGAAGKPVNDSVIPPRKRGNTGSQSGVVGLPLSFEEEGLWLVDQLEPDSALYNIPIGLRIKGTVDVLVLQRCLNEILERHEALRTHFELEGGHPVQVVGPAVPLEMPLVDLSGMPGDKGENEALRLCNAEAQRPFVLRREILFRAMLFRLAEKDHLLFLNVHHIVADGWSVNVLVRELTILYQAFTDGKSSPLPPLPIQYADYAVWQRGRLQGESLEKQLGYWREKLAGIPALLELPTDRLRPAISRYRGAEVSRELPQGLVDELGKFTRQEGTTLFIVLLSAFQALLQRYTGQGDVPVGTPVAGRNWKGAEDLVGFFVNTVVLRGDLGGDPSFRTLLKQTQEMALEAFVHQDVPFELLVKDLQPKRNTSYSALFQVMLAFLELSPETTHCAGLEISTLILNSGTSKFDFTLFVRKRGEALQLVAEYNTDLFDAQTIERMLGHYQKLLEGIISNPDGKISRLPLLTEAERHQILAEWNETRAEYPREKCVHELIEEQVERTPEAVAVVFEGQVRTYRQLNERANQLARHLRGLGVGPDCLVGIAMERSLEMMVGLLGILKAGGAYVPLDPEYPRDRLAFIMEDSKIPILLTQTRSAGHLPPHRAKIILLDAFDTPPSDDNLPRLVTPENLAYVIYTSGSTGNPKGTLIPHRGLTNYITWAAKAYDVSEGRGAPVHSSISFDLTITGLFAPLLTGASVHLVPESMGLEGLATCLLNNKDFSLVKITPAHLKALSHQLPANAVAGHTRAFIIGGEALFGEDVTFWQKHAPNTVLVNEYGPTETVVGCCVYFVPKNKPLHGTIPIGRPIANTQLYILDSSLNPVPIGVKGELYIGGDGVGRGYLNQPNLTAEKFIANPFFADPGSRLYRTGDLARYLPDGNVEYLGRLDHQVKIRGFRIELGEIELALSEHPGVREAAVTLHESVPGDKRLAAYLVSKNGAISSSDLREFLRNKLPDYMVPAVFMTLPALPLTPNGKVDRKALPQPEFAQTKKFVPPGTPTEIALAKIWCEVLGLEQIGVNDNFFESGGHSLLAIRLLSRINGVLKLNLPVRTLFQNPTIEGLAGHLSAGLKKEGEPELIQVNKGHSDRELFFLIDEGSLGLLKLAHMVHGDLSIYASLAPLPEPALKASMKRQYSALPRMEELAAKHAALIMSRPANKPVLLVGHCFGGWLAFEVAHQLQRAGRQVETILMLDTWMAKPAFWQLKTIWLKTHVKKLLKQGPSYLWQKSLKRINLEKNDLASRLNLATHGNFNAHIPWTIIERIYRHAKNNYILRELTNQGILFVSREDWLSNAYRQMDNTLEAGRWFGGGVEVVDVPGDHVTVLDESHLAELAQCCEKVFEKLSSKQVGPQPCI
jgi:amino acid adenylation domain-containing protein